MAFQPNVFGRKWGLTGALGTVMLTAAFAQPAQASFTPKWLSPVKLSADGSNAQTPVVSMDGSGDSEGVWALASGTVQGSFRQAGPGDSFAEQDIGGSSSAASPALDVGEDQSGNEEAVWLQSGTPIAVNWSWRTNDVDGFGAGSPVTGDACTGDESDPKVAVDPNGDVVAAWLCNDAGQEVVEAAYAQRGTAGTFDQSGNPAPMVLSNPADTASNISIGMDPNGNAVVTWQEPDASTKQQIWFSYRATGQGSSFTTAHQVAVNDTSDEASPSVTMDGSGDAAAVWTFNGLIEEADATQAQLTAATPSFGSANALTSTGTSTVPQVADDGNGDTAVIWAQGGNTEANVRPSGGSFAGSATSLGTIDASSAPQIAIAGNNDPIALWQSGFTIQSESADSNGTWSGTAAQVSAVSNANHATEPSLAVDGQGNAIAGWLQSDNTNVLAMAAGYDGTGPIGAAHLHDAGVAGQALTYYAKATDVWPAISFSWDFGDGDHRTGANVVYAFPQAGNYTVTETATASDGNDITATQPITVAATAPAVPIGGLRQLVSPNDCVSSAAFGCGTLIQSGVLNAAFTPVVSPDGKDVYEVAEFGGLAEFSRNSTTGALTEIGCITGGAASTPGCTTSALAAMDNPSSIAISPDGADVYVVTQGENAILTFSRNASTGLLTEASGDCYSSNSVAGCTSNPGLSYPWGVVVSSDGKNVYATSNNGQDIAEFTRNTATGALTPIAGNNCISDAANPNGCQVANADGLLNLIGVAADGSNVYGLAGGGLAHGDVAEFTRDASTGALSPIPGNACIGDASTGCPTSGADINGTEDMAITPDGQHAYVNSNNNDAIVELDRNTSTGALTQFGCVETSSGPAGLCGTTNAVGINTPLGVAVSPDGVNLYASGAGSAAEAAFEIDQTTGQLTQLPAPFNCLTLDTSGCGVNHATGLNGARRVVVSPDGKNVYVAGQGSAAIVALARTPVPARAASTTGTEASWDSNSPATSASATVTVTAVNCSANPAGTIAGQEQGVRLIGTYTHNQHTSYPSQQAEILSYCNGKTPTYATLFVINNITTGTMTFQPAGLAVAPGDPVQLTADAGQALQMTNVNTGKTVSASGPAYTAVNGFDIGISAITGNGAGAPLLSGSQPDASPPAVLPGPVQSSPVVFQNVTVNGAPLSHAAGLYTVHWTGAGNSTLASPSSIANTNQFAGDIASVPPPALARSADVAPVSGKVLVKLPGTRKFVLLTSIRNLPIGTIIDVTHGSVQITVALPNGGLQTGIFFDGKFKLEQKASGQTTALLVDGTYKGCPKPPKPKKHKKHKKHGAPDAIIASSHKRRPKGSHTGSLWSNAHGSFGTQGRYGAGAVRGTEWFTQDQCDGTFFKVTRDAITVTSFTRHRQTVVTQGHHFLAPAPGFK